MTWRMTWRVTRLALLLPLLCTLLAAPALAISDPAEMLPDRRMEARAEQIGSQLRCLVCQNESIEDSQADLARDLRRIVRQQVMAGKTDKQVMDWMVARYGDFVRLRPPFEPLTWLLWFSPLLALGAGLLVAWIGRRQAPPQAPAPLSAAEQERLAELTRQ